MRFAFASGAPPGFLCERWPADAASRQVKLQLGEQVSEYIPKTRGAKRNFMARVLILPGDCVVIKITQRETKFQQPEVQLLCVGISHKMKSLIIRACQLLKKFGAIWSAGARGAKRPGLNFN
jgi:hypothetical protein